MEIFGWICLVTFALYGFFMLGIIVGPYVISKVKSFKYRTDAYIEAERVDADKRAEDKINRDDIKRKKDLELADKKLEVKLSKVDKQIKLQSEKLELAKKLKRQLADEVEERQEVVQETPKQERVFIVEKVEPKTIEPIQESFLEAEELEDEE